MSYASWPVGLPAMFTINGLSGEEPDVNIREDTDIGPAKVRPRYTAASEPMSGQLLLGVDQLASFRSFYRSTLYRGSLPFYWLDPRDASLALFRFVGAFKWEAWNGMYVVTFQVEKLPGGSL